MCCNHGKRTDIFVFLVCELRSLIFSKVPSGVGSGFGPLFFRPSRWRAYESCKFSHSGTQWHYHDGDHPLSFLLNHIQFEALSVVSSQSLLSFFLADPFIPSNLLIFQMDLPTNPLHPTSIGVHQVLHPARSHCPFRSSYLVRFLS